MRMLFPVLLLLLFLAPSQAAFSMDQVWAGKLKAPAKPDPATLVAVPEALQNLWILNSCEEGIIGHRFSRRFMMTSTAWGSKIERIGGLTDKGDGRYGMVTRTEILNFIIGTKGDLIQIYGDINTSFSLTALENFKIRVPHVRFKNCSKAAAIVVKENSAMVALLPGLDNIHEACPTTAALYKTDCQKSIFSLFDMNEDAALDQEEMAKAWRTIIPNSSFTACDAAGAGATRLSADGLTYFSWLFTNLDKNTDKKISFTEIQGQWTLMQVDPLMSEATNILIAAATPLALLPENITGTCVNCCIPVATP